MINATAASAVTRSKTVMEKEKPMQVMKIGAWLGLALIPVLTLSSFEAAAQSACNPRTEVLGHLAKLRHKLLTSNKQVRKTDVELQLVVGLV